MCAIHLTIFKAPVLCAQVQEALHNYLSSAEVRSAMDSFAGVLNDDGQECSKENPLLGKPALSKAPPIAQVSPPLPSSPEMEVAFQSVEGVLEEVLDKLEEVVVGMLGEFDTDCRRIEVGRDSQIAH